MVEPNPQSNGVIVAGPDFAMTLQGIDGGGVPLPLAPDGVLVLQRDRVLRASGSGFFPNSYVTLTIDPPVIGSAALLKRSPRASSGTYLGRVFTDARGSFDDTVVIGASIGVGDHVVQAVGVTQSNVVRSVNLGVRVQDPSTRPGAVRDLALVSTTSTTIALSWVRPLSNGGSRILGYKVRHRAFNAETYSGKLRVAKLSATITGLTPGMTYYVRVKAFNDVGTGPSNDFIKVRLPKR
jgi:hypothetical protein